MNSCTIGVNFRLRAVPWFSRSVVTKARFRSQIIPCEIMAEKFAVRRGCLRDLQFSLVSLIP